MQVYCSCWLCDPAQTSSGGKFPRSRWSQASACTACLPALLPACPPACLAIILLQLEKAQKSPARVQLLFERVVANFPVTSQLWLQYGRYLESEIKVHDVINKVKLQPCAVLYCWCC